MLYHLLKGQYSYNPAIQNMGHKLFYTSPNPFHTMNPILCWVSSTPTFVRHTKTHPAPTLTSFFWP